MANDIAIDLGTSTVLVYVKDKGIVLTEPSVVVVEINSGKVIKVGREAQQLLGRTPAGLAAVHPMKDGVIAHYDMTLQMLKYLLKKTAGQTFFKPRVLVCVPGGINEVEERAVCQAALRAGAKKAYLMEEPIAAAIGAGLDVSQPMGNMVVDIGGGTTDIAVISLGNIVVSDSVKIAGNKIDEAIVKYMRRKHSMLIGETTAESLKIKIGSVSPNSENVSVEVKGRCLIEGLPKKAIVTTADLLEAMDEPITAIINAICHVIESTPPALVADIASAGIVLTGGSAKLKGLPQLIESVTGIKTIVAQNPQTCVAEGTGRSLENLSEIPEGVRNISRNRQ